MKCQASVMSDGNVNSARYDGYNTVFSTGTVLLIDELSIACY